MRSVKEDYPPEDPALLGVVDEHGDDGRQQIISIFPTFVFQRPQNVMALRHYLPRGPPPLPLPP